MISCDRNINNGRRKPKQYEFSRWRHPSPRQSNDFVHLILKKHSLPHRNQGQKISFKEIWRDNPRLDRQPSPVFLFVQGGHATAVHSTVADKD
jgi:hypothetical protein